MSDQTNARFLETTFRPFLAAVPGLTVYLRQEPLTEDPNGRRLPCAIIKAERVDYYRAVKVAGRFGETFELELQVRVAGGPASSDQALEALMKQAQTAVESASGITGWLFLQLLPMGGKSSGESQTRVRSIFWRVHGLTAV